MAKKRERYTAPKPTFTRPTNLQGIAGAKLSTTQSIRRLKSQLEALEYLCNEENPREMMGHAHAAANDVDHIIEEASAWAALLYVADGTYRDPKVELQEIADAKLEKDFEEAGRLTDSAVADAHEEEDNAEEED